MACPFCELVVVKKETFYEDDFFRAIYNIRPVVKGHCLVVPKRHVEEIYQLNKNEQVDFVSFSDRALFIAMKYSNTNEFDLLLQKGENAGQSIKHLHFHIIPRKRNDSISVPKKDFLQSFQARENDGRNLSGNEMHVVVSEMKEIAEKHRMQINEL